MNKRYIVSEQSSKDVIYAASLIAKAIGVETKDIGAFWLSSSKKSIIVSFDNCDLRQDVFLREETVEKDKCSFPIYPLSGNSYSNISDIIFKTIKNMNAGTVIEKTEEMKEREAKAKILLEKGKDLTAQEQLDLLPIGTKASVKKRKKIILDDAEKRVKKELDKLLANSVQLCLDYKLSAHIEGSHSIRYAVLLGSGKENVTISDYSFLQYSGGELVPDKEIEFVAEKLEYKVIHSQKVKNIYKERFIRENAIKHFEPVFSYMEKVFREADGWQVILDDDFVLQVAVQKCWFTDDERIDICQFLTKSDYQYEVRANKDKLSATVRWLVSCDEMLERVQIAITENTFSIKNASSQVISAVNQKKNVVLEQVYARVDDESKIWNKGTDSVYHFFTGIDLQKLNEKVRWFVRLCLEGKSMSMSDITLFGYSDSMKIVVKNNMKPKIQYKDEIKQLIDESKKQRYQKALSAASAAFSDYRITAIIQLNEGLLHGNASVSLKNKETDISFEHTFELPDYRDSLTEWKKALKKQMSIVQKRHETLFYEKKQKYIKENRSIIGSCLCIDILKCISYNSYITAAALVQLLRGTQIQLDACITRPDNIGVYKAYTKDEVEDEIDFMIRQGFIGRKRRENYYTVYYILTMTAKGKDLLKFLSKADEKDIKWTDTYKIDQIRRYSNQMSNGEVKMLTNAEYLQLVDLCKNPGMISNISEELTSILGKAPESIGQYIQMLSGAESNSHVKRLYKNIISVSKAEKKK